jgi:hypothetical protein
VLVLGLLAGCSSDPAPDEGGGSPGPSPTQTSSDSTSSAGTPSPEPTPSVEPATGKKLTIPGIEGDVFTFRLPEGDWLIGRAGRAGNLTTGLKYWTIDGGATPAFGSTTLDVGAQGAIENRSLGGPKLSRSDNRVVDGVEGYVVEGKDRSGFTYIYGTVVGDSLAYVQFDFADDSPKAKSWVESVLASVEWL